MDKDSVGRTPTMPDKSGNAGTRVRWAHVLVVSGLILYAVVLAIQSARDGSPPKIASIGPADAGDVSLSIAYPEKLLRDRPAGMRYPLSAWLTYAGHSPLPPAPYTVSLEPATAGVEFVDETGSPVSPRLVLTPTVGAAVRATFYLEQAGTATGDEGTVALTARLFDPQANELTAGKIVFGVQLETRWQAFWRRFWERVFSPTTPLLTLAAGLVALAVQEYRRVEERRLQAEAQQREHAFRERLELEKRRLDAEEKRLAEKERARNDTRLAEIDAIHRLIPYQIAEALDRYIQCARLAETSQEWRSEEISRRLTGVWDALESSQWQATILAQAASLLNDRKYVEVDHLVSVVLRVDEESAQAKDLRTVNGLAQCWSTNDDRLFTLVGKRGIKGTIDTIKRVSRLYYLELDDLAHRILVRLSHHPDYSEAVRLVLDKYPSGQALLRRLDWPSLWPRAHLAHSRDVTEWLRKAELSFHPFESDAAEMDVRLPEYVHTSVFENALADRPLVVVGAPGAGKTATALMLAFDCGHPSPKPTRRGTFPVFHQLQLDTAQMQDTGAILAPMVRATARGLLQYLSLHPERLLDLPIFGQSAIFQFIAFAYAGENSMLANDARYLSSRLRKSLEPTWNEVSTISWRNADWLNLLDGTLPDGFHRYEWLIDVPGQLSARLPEGLPNILVRLIDMSTRLATAGVHLKLFVSDELAGILGDAPGMETVHLEWDRGHLEQMLTDRVGRTGGRQFSELCRLEEAPDFQDRLIAAAQGSPRRLVQLGNELIKSAARRADQDPRFAEVDWNNACQAVQSREAMRAPIDREHRHLTRLHQILVTHFDVGEMRTLCFRLGVDFDDLSGTTKSDKARELVTHLDRRKQISDLIAEGQRVRPNVVWDENS